MQYYVFGNFDFLRDIQITKRQSYVNMRYIVWFLYLFLANDFYLFWRKKDKLNTFWRKKKCIMIRRSRLCWVWSSRQCEFLFFACDSSCLWSRKLCVRKLITRIINNTLINKNMFRIGELDDTIHSTLSSSSMGLLDSNSDAMSMKKEKSEIDFFQLDNYKSNSMTLKSLYVLDSYNSKGKARIKKSSI